MDPTVPTIDELISLFKRAHPRKILSGTALKYTEQGFLCVSFSVVTKVFVTSKSDLLYLKKEYQRVPISGLVFNHIESLEAVSATGSTINRIQLCYKIL